MSPRLFRRSPSSSDRTAAVNRCSELYPVGRVLVAEVLPAEVPLDYVNKVLDKKALSALIDPCYRLSRNKAKVLLADRMRAGVSICMDDMEIPLPRPR